MNGELYIVATPIGNLDDISLRAVAILKSVDLIAAEDTRHSRPLLQHLGIRSKLLSYHQHNESARSEQLLSKLQAGESVALISDAGTPLISDPGYKIVRAAQQAGVRVTPIPGASSVVTALSVSGLPTDQFHFSGFLSSKPRERLSQLTTLRSIDATLVLFESRHRIAELLLQITEVFGLAECVIAKELTKLHERILHGSASDLLAQLQAEAKLDKGEFVVLIDNSAGQVDQSDQGEDLRMMKILLESLPLKQAVKIATDLSSRKKNELYAMAINLKNDNSQRLDDNH